MRLRTRLSAALVVLIASVVLVPAALASVSASMSLNQSAGTSAGGSENLGLDLAFTNSSGDSPKGLTLELPPGLLANAALDGGACIKTAASTSPNAACEVGTATVTASAVLALPASLPVLPPIQTPVSIPVGVNFYLVAPPAAGDLAGLEVYAPSLDQELGSPGDVLIRPSADPDGVGATIKLTLPDTLNLTYDGLSFPGAQIAINSIDSTLDNLRYPTTCPSGGLPFISQVTGYTSGDATQTLTAPLSVTGCSSLSYSPALSLSAAKDSGDDHVALTTSITQTATQAPSSAIALSFPTSVFSADLDGLGNLCLGAVGGCTAVGSVTADSPLYPTALTGQAYLTGAGGGLSLTLTFPAPFPLTLVGSVSLLTNTASFTGLPDIPLTQLAVDLNGGSRALFATGCNPASGTSTAHLVDQNNDQSRSLSAAFSVSDCPHVTPAVGSTGSGAGSGPGSGSGSGGSSGNPGSTSGSAGSGSSGSGSSAGTSGTSSTPVVTVSGTHLVAGAISGLGTGRPSLRFTVSVKKHASRITRLTVTLPRGLSVRSRHAGRRTVIRGVSLRGAKVRSLRLSHHHLVITLRHGSSRVRVTLGPTALRETRALRVKAQKRTLKRLRLTVAVRNAARHTRTLTVTVHTFHLT